MGDASQEASPAAGKVVSVEGGEDKAAAAEEAGKEDGKLSLRMKLVTPVEEGSSEHFSLQSENSPPARDDGRSAVTLSLTCFLSLEPPLSEEDETVATVTTVSTAVTR